MQVLPMSEALPEAAVQTYLTVFNCFDSLSHFIVDAINTSCW